MIPKTERPYWWPATWNTHDPSDYQAKLADMDKVALRKHCEEIIWLSSYAANNPRSDFHWMCDAAFAEAETRDGDIYQAAYDTVWKQNFG